MFSVTSVASVVKYVSVASSDQKWYLSPSIIWRGPIFTLVI